MPSPVPGLVAAVSAAGSSAPPVDDGSGGVGALDVVSPSMGVSEVDVSSDFAGAAPRTPRLRFVLLLH